MGVIGPSERRWKGTILCRMGSVAGVGVDLLVSPMETVEVTVVAELVLDAFLNRWTRMGRGAVLELIKVVGIELESKLITGTMSAAGWQVHRGHSLR
jgi:hypothetical protein